MKFEDARKHKKEITRLYKTAFPRIERPPIWLLFYRTDNGRDNFYAVLDKNEFIGLVYTIKTEKMVYVFFLAVAEGKRQKGYGTKILSEIRKMYPNQVITLLIEDTEDINADNIEQRMRRLKFYETNGFSRLHIKINEIGVVYELLGTENSVTQADFLELMKDYVGTFLFKIMYRKTKLQ